MAILFMEGFDGYKDGTAFRGDGRISLTGTADSFYFFLTGRNGSGQCLETNGTSIEFLANISGASDTVWIQFAMKLESGVLTSTEELIWIYDTNGTITSGIYLTATGEIEVKQGTGTTVGTSSGAGVTVGSWHFYEFKIKLNASTGTVLVKVDGTEVLNLSGVDTINGGTSPSKVRFHHNDDIGSGDILWDDMVIGDDSTGSPGDVQTDLLGDCSVEMLLPDGAGNYTQFTPSTGSNYQNVDDVPSSDSDTTYNSSSTAGHKDSFTCGNLTGAAGTIYAVQVTSIAKRESGGGRLMRELIRSNSVDATGASRYVPAGYTHKQALFEKDPSGADWTVSTVNSMEIGYELET
jgi:hypothetical protein